MKKFKYLDEALSVRKLVEDHHRWFGDCLLMIASENLISPMAREMLISDLCDRYAEGLPGKRYYQGLIYIDDIERKCIELAKKVFNAPYADVRPVSATVANIGILFALTSQVDTPVPRTQQVQKPVQTVEGGRIEGNAPGGGLSPQQFGLLAGHPPAG